MERIHDMIIIGGGPAGYTAALYAARAGLDVLVIERMSAGGQMAVTDTIDNYSGFSEGIPGWELGMKMQAGAERFGAVTKYGEVVSAELEGNIKKVRTSSDEFGARTVVIATGANPRELGVDREEEFVSRGVHYCAHCDGRFYKNKVVAVVGGGNSALEDALYLSRLAAKVYLIHRRDSFRASKIYVDALSKSTNIEFLANSSVAELIADERVTGIRLADGRELEINGLFVSIGRKPASDIFRGQLKLDEGGYIVADESTRTSIAGVYAIGDVRTKPLRQVVTAVGDGAVAVHFAEEYLAECD
ncbi:MAG: thioredoxin-disulfide reductase [Clostridia bacterium]|nr:thioredoxin-disulfide reductase [Clostridia bacterium]